MDNNTLAEVLVLHNVTKGDAGEYTCYIGTDIKSVELMATLTVIEEGMNSLSRLKKTILFGRWCI